MAEQPVPLRLAVVGGGLTGLATAHRLLELSAAAGRRIALTLFEANDHLGGVIATKQIGGYTVELGADSFITNKPWGVQLCERLGLADRLIPTDNTHRRSLVLRRGRPETVPEGFQLLSPVKIGPVLMSRIFSPWGKLRMALEYFVPRRKQQTDESLASFVRRRFGRETLDRLVQPLVGGIYTSDPEKLSLQATMPRFVEMERDFGSLIRALRSTKSVPGERASGARYGLFATLAGGIGELLQTLEQRVRAGAEIRLGTRVADLTPLNGNGQVAGAAQVDGSLYPHQGFQLSLADGTKAAFDAVVLTIAAPQISSLVRTFAAQAAGALAAIEYASTAIVVTGHKLADIRHPLDAFGLVIPAAEKRRVLAVSFTSRKFPNRAPAGCVQLRTFVGGAMQPELAELPDHELRSLVRSELESLLGVSGTEDFCEIARWRKAMPQYHVGHLERVEAIDQDLARHPRLALAGNAYRGVGIPDCIHSAEQAAERVWRGLQP